MERRSTRNRSGPGGSNGGQRSGAESSYPGPPNCCPVWPSRPDPTLEAAHQPSLASVAAEDPARILLVGSDPGWVDGANGALSADGFVVETHPSLDDVASHATVFRPDLVVVDLWSLPHGSGVAVCTTLRAQASASLVAAGRRAADDLVLSALAAGADIFAPRDASPRELLARIRALLRRLPPVRPRSAEHSACGPLRLDTARRKAFVAGHEVDLAEPEFRILASLLRTPGRAVSRTELTDACGGTSTASALDRHIRQLRHRLEAAEGVRHITAVRGMGFRYEPTAPAADNDAASQ